MPPSWSSRLLSGSSSNPTSRSTSYTGRDKPLPRAPSADQSTADPLNPPTLRPRTASGKHTHNRSVSHPLPRLFSRKKSGHNLGSPAITDDDLPLDESLVPVLDEPLDAPPMRVISGRKKGGEDDGKVGRRCMCCDSKVKVPKELDKFRCMCCLTVNDFNDGGRKEREGGEGRGIGVKMPVSVERTRMVVDRCVGAYLEARCRRAEDGMGIAKKADSPVGDERPSGPVRASTENDATTSVPVSTKQRARTSQQLSDAPVSSSPPDTPGSAGFPPLTHAATIRDFSDFDLFAYERKDTPPPTARPPTSGPGPPPPGPASLPRRPVPGQPIRKPPPLPLNNMARRTPSHPLRPGAAAPMMNGERSPRPQQSPRLTFEENEARKRYDRVKTIFRPLEDYIASSFGDYQCLNTSFSTVRPAQTGRTKSESHIVTPPPEPAAEYAPSPVDVLSGLDAKTLLLGDIGENGSWWTGKLDRHGAEKAFKRKKVGSGVTKPVSSKSPNIHWAQLADWYDAVHSAGSDWQRKVHLMKQNPSVTSKAGIEGRVNVQEIEEDLAEAREHAVRALLKVTENLLKRPTTSIKEPEDMRFLLIILSNPSLYPSKRKMAPSRSASSAARELNRNGSSRITGLYPPGSPPQASPRRNLDGDSSSHTGILKRVFGLIANSSDMCHRYLITWFSRFDEEHFTGLVDLVASFVTHRIARRGSKPRRKSQAADGGLIPDLSGGAMNTSAQLHSAMGLGGSIKKMKDDPDQETDWASDWQIKVAAKIMSLLFAANNIWQGRRKDEEFVPRIDSGIDGQLQPIRPQDKARRSGQLLHTSSFYNTLLDYHDLIADFKVWEGKRDKFAFCQYPLFLSMGAKIKILEYDARRQMEIKAREAYFDQVIRQRAIDGYFHLRVRRDCMVDDSLRQISEAVGAGQEELKKGLRVHFAGEEGVDAGGPRKEWFLMLVREVFDAEHGLFVYDDDSRTCYFNPNTFETSDQYYLVGALLGLAIYNSTILDIALPPFAFRKLLAAAPANAQAANNITSLTGTKGQMTYTLSDLAEFRPQLAAGLQQLLDFDGDVETTYCWSFVAPLEHYGAVTSHPLMSNGENTPVTNANRAEFVEAYVRFLLDGAVARQFEPFKRGFFTVCAGNALSLFRAEEIELLIRGSDESLDVDSLRAVAVYENWKYAHPPFLLQPKPAETVPVIGWFWDAFASADPKRQRQLLTFITGSDRIPAVGATSLVLRIIAGGDGTGSGAAAAAGSGLGARKSAKEVKEERERFPVARTCFNVLILWFYESREVLEEKLWRAVEDSEGFGLK